MEALSDAQKLLIAQIISNPSLFATYRQEPTLPMRLTGPSDASQPIFPLERTTLAQEALATQVSPRWLESATFLPVNGTVQQVVVGPVLEEHRQGTVTPTPSDLAETPTNRQILRNRSQSPDFGGFKPCQISDLVASFIPSFDTDDSKNLKSKPLATGEYEEIGMHMIKAIGGMLNEQRPHFLPVLGGLLVAIITTLDAEILKYDKTSEKLTRQPKWPSLLPPEHQPRQPYGSNCGNPLTIWNLV